MLWEFLNLPMHNTVCCSVWFFLKEFIISSKLEFNCNTQSWWLLKDIFSTYTALLLRGINANKCGQYCFQILQAIVLLVTVDPIPSVLDYLIFSHLQTQKWKSGGIWATLFSSRTSTGVQSIAFLNTTYTTERTPSSEESPLRGWRSLWEDSFHFEERIWTLRKIPSCYSLS